MTVYVDDAKHPYGRMMMMMCHMIADNRKELFEMADRIGVRRKWLQKAGTPHEHFDICLSKRELAVMAGAVEVTSRELILKCRMKEMARSRSDS